MAQSNFDLDIFWILTKMLFHRRITRLCVIPTILNNIVLPAVCSGKRFSKISKVFTRKFYFIFNIHFLKTTIGTSGWFFCLLKQFHNVSPWPIASPSAIVSGNLWSAVSGKNETRNLIPGEKKTVKIQSISLARSF